MSQSASVVRRTPRFMVGALVLLLWCALSVGGGATAAADATDEPTTQTLTLEEGWNLVSLHTAPADPSFAVVFEGITDQLVGIQDQRGRLYLPQEVIIQIDTWQVDESYLIYMAASATLAVEGIRVRPELTEVPLHEGWNLIPTLHANPLPAAAAFDSIADVLLLVKDDLGNIYSPALDLVMFDELRPGRGYWLYATDASTLTYPEDPSLAPLPIEVSTLADALALTDLEVGQQVQVQGYHTPGDGGGGLFDVTDDACTTDGGTCFVFDEDRSAVMEATTSHNLTSPRNLVQTDLVWGSIEVQYGATLEETLGTEYLHGHSTASTQYDWIDYKAGTIGSSSAGSGGTGARFTNVRSWAGYSNSDPFTVRYQYATSARRMKRVDVTDSVDIKWWGAQEADPQNPTNEWWRIAYAVNAAAKLYEQGGIDWAYVDIPGEFYYRNTIRLRNGVMLRGTSTDTFGDAANGQPTYGKLTYMPGMAMYHQKRGWSGVESPLRYQEIDLTHAYMIEKVGMQSLHVDGNVANNMEPIDDPNEEEYTEVQTKLQNGNQWNGFASRGNNSWQTPDNAVAQFIDVYIHDFPGNTLGMNNALDWTPSKNVRVGDAARNHQIYRTRGLHDSWTIEEAGWASLLKVTSGSFTNLTVKPGPNFLTDFWGNTWFKVFDHHGKGFGWDPVDQFDRTRELIISVDGFEVDLSNGNDTAVTVFGERGFGGEYKNGTIYGTTNQNTRLFSAVDTGGNGPIRDYVYDNISVVHQGRQITISGFGGHHTHNQFKNISIDDRGGPSGGDYFGIPRGTAADFSDPYVDQGPIPSAARLDVEYLVDETLRNNWIFLPTGEGSFPYDTFVSHSSIRNDDTINARGILAGGPGSFRLYLHDVTFNVWMANQSFRAAKFHWETIGPNARVRLRDSQDREGRVSDSVDNTFISGAGDEGKDYVLIPTNLMSYANEHEIEIATGPSDITISSVEVTDNNGTPRPTSASGDMVEMRDPYLRVNLNRTIAAGETLALDWTARVTPLDAFAPTGVFISRPIADHTISAATEVDLRGVAASMESREAIMYSASSDDDTIVSASVQSDGFTLDLTPGSAGTATVAVTGQIPEIGSVAYSFTVVVE